MSCPYFVGNGCGCNGCARFAKTTAVAVVGGNLQLTIPNTTINNHQRLCICIAQAIPGTVTPDTPVTVLVNGTAFSVITSCANKVYADQVKPRTILHVVAATDTNLLKLTDARCLCPTSHVFPVIAPVSVVSVAETVDPAVAQNSSAKKA